MLLKLWPRFRKHIKPAAQRVRAFPSKLGQCLWKHIDNIFFIFVLLLLAALAVDVMDSDDTVRGLQDLLGLKGEKYDVLKFIGYCVAGVVSIWLAWAANKRANAMDATAKNTEKGQRQERLKNAIEHLGHDRDSVRMSGAHELFHLAKDTEDLRQTVMDILCAHIRQTTRGKDYQAEHKTKPSEEIQALLTLLFTQEPDVFIKCSINLQESYLNGANLSQAQLKKANLIAAQMQGVSLWQAQMQEADFFRAQLQEAQLQEADFERAQLQRADLMTARLQGANLMVAQMQGADLSEAWLQGANLMGTWLQGANLRNAQLQGTNLFNAHLQEADLMEAQLQGAVLGDAQLQGANLMEARLQGADLSMAQLQGADLSKAQLQGVSSPADYLRDFESNIRNQIGEPSARTGIIFAGGLQEEDLDALCGALSAGQAQALRKKLRPHVGKPASNELPADSGAVIGTYTHEEAEQMIAEFNKARQSGRHS